MARTVLLRAGPLDGARHRLGPGELCFPGIVLEVSCLHVSETLEIADRRIVRYRIRPDGLGADHVAAAKEGAS